jgi:hypothetical protein
VFILAVLSVLLTTVGIIDAHRAASSPNPASRKELICRVEAVSFDPHYSRFFQPRPTYFQRLDSALRVSLTNETGRPLYIRGHSVAALLGIAWVPFKNADGRASSPYSFGEVAEGQLVRFDLSQNGFDYVMGLRPLNTDENLRLWMFFTSGLSISDRPNITQFKFSFHGSTGEEFPCNSDYSIKTDMGIAIGTETTIGNVDLRMYSREPIPPDLREEGYP